MSILSIRWVPKDALDGMQQLDAMEELAYRRIIDLIYVTENNLEDDDKKLAWMTKTGRDWKRVKATLIRLGKIEISEHKIVNRKCTFTIQETVKYIEQQRSKGIVSAEKRKQQKNNNTTPTTVATGSPTEHITEVPTGHPTGGQVAFSLKEESKKERDANASQKKGSRLALTELPDDWKEFCEVTRPELNPNDLFAEFRDYWAGVPGQRGRKLDWFATWRNRVRDKIIKNTGGNPHANIGGISTRPTKDDRARAAVLRAVAGFDDQQPHGEQEAIGGTSLS